MKYLGIEIFQKGKIPNFLEEITPSKCIMYKLA